MALGAKHILVNSYDDLVNLREQIVQNIKTFDTVARESSICPSKDNGGDLGLFETGQMVQPFEDAVNELQVGQLSLPIETQFGWHLIVRTV